MNAISDSGLSARLEALAILKGIAALQPRAVGPKERNQFHIALLRMKTSMQAHQQVNLLENVILAAQVEARSDIERMGAKVKLTQGANARLPEMARKLIHYIELVPDKPPESFSIP